MTITGFIDIMILNTAYNKYGLLNNITMKSLLILLFLLGFSSIYCQTSSRSDDFWISCGPGGFFANNIGTEAALSFYCSANWLRNKFGETANGPKHWNNKWEIRLINHLELIQREGVLHHYDFDLLYGKSYGKVIQVNISGGIGVLRGEKEVVVIDPQSLVPPTFKREKYLTPNIPLEVEFSLIPTKYFGIGIAGFANLNTKRSINGIILKLELGKRR